MAKWLTLSPVVVESRVPVPARVTFRLTFNFFMNDHLKCQIPKHCFFFFKLISKKKYSIILKLEIILCFT